MRASADSGSVIDVVHLRKTFHRGADMLALYARYIPGVRIVAKLQPHAAQQRPRFRLWTNDQHPPELRTGLPTIPFEASILRAPLFVLLLLSDPSAEAAAGFVGLGGLDDGSEVRIHRCARLVGLPAEAIQLCSVELSVLPQSH